MTDPHPTTAAQQHWSPEQALARILDLAALADRRPPAWRYLTTAAIRAAITGRVS